jgi:hypothetical protein
MRRGVNEGGRIHPRIARIVEREGSVWSDMSDVYAIVTPHERSHEWHEWHELVLMGKRRGALGWSTA